MFRKCLPLVFVCCLTTGLAVGAEAAKYRICDLGALGSGYSYARAINNKNQVAGASAYRAFFWENGKMLDLGSGDANGINESGQVVGYATSTGHAFLWQNGVKQDLGVVGDKWSIAFAINNSGWVAGYIQPNLKHAALWRNGTMEDLGTLGGAYSDAKAVNNAGQVVGQSSPATSNTHAYLWQNGIMQDLGTLPKSSYSCAHDINDKGQIVGESGSAFLWENGVMTNLGSLPGHTISTAYATNNVGQIVGQADYQRAVLWQNGTIQDLGTLGGTSACAYAINDNGWIAGWASDANQQQHAVIWQPVPEPSGIIALLCGMGGLGFLRLRKR